MCHRSVRVSYASQSPWMANRLPPPAHGDGKEGKGQSRGAGKGSARTCTRGGDLTHGEEHGAGPLAAPRPRPAVAEDPSLLRHEVVLEGFDQQVLALGVMPHQQLRVHVAHQEVPAQQGQPHALHELRGEESGGRQVDHEPTVCPGCQES